MKKQFSEALLACNVLSFGKTHDTYNEIELGDEILEPSYLVMLAAFINKHKVNKKKIKCPLPETQAYLDEIGFGGADLASTQHNHHSGKNHSMLTLLDSEDATDAANQQIISYISQFTEYASTEGINSLKEVIGELHDNIWAHGKATGYSMVQLYQSPYQDEIVFAVADCGIGFLAELKRVGIEGIDDDEAAIRWCLEKGNSSKKVEAAKLDDWTQQLPPDVIGNPMRGIAKYQKSNNHAGLGLGKLVDLVRYYKGEMDVVSGKKQLSINSDGTRITNLPGWDGWQGVAICIRLNYTGLRQAQATEDAADIDAMLKELTL